MSQGKACWTMLSCCGYRFFPCCVCVNTGFESDEREVQRRAHVRRKSAQGRGERRKRKRRERRMQPGEDDEVDEEGCLLSSNCCGAVCLPIPEALRQGSQLCCLTALPLCCACGRPREDAPERERESEHYRLFCGIHCGRCLFGGRFYAVIKVCAHLLYPLTRPLLFSHARYLPFIRSFAISHTSIFSTCRMPHNSPHHSTRLTAFPGSHNSPVLLLPLDAGPTRKHFCSSRFHLLPHIFFLQWISPKIPHVNRSLHRVALPAPRHRCARRHRRRRRPQVFHDPLRPVHLWLGPQSQHRGSEQAGFTGRTTRTLLPRPARIWRDRSHCGWCSHQRPRR